MQRVSVVGNSASGKTTFAANLARLLDAEHIELDSIFHQADWTPLPDDEFRARVQDRIRATRWVTDGNYKSVRDLIWNEVDTIIWLDVPRRYVRTRVVRRTLGRMVRRTELWNGNRERVRNLVNPDPTESIILWAWTQHQQYVDRYTELMSDPRWASKHWVRLQHPREVQQFLDAVAAEAHDV